MRRGLEDELGGFLARWSRRKAAARRGAPEPDEPAAARPQPGASGEGGPGPAGEPTPAAAAEPRASGPEPSPAGGGLDLAELPDPDTLDAASDFSAFMRPGVPAELRRRALRRLWKVNPIISTPDGLDDYYVVNDFSDASTVVADLKTVYRVGRGMVAALEAEEAAAADAAADGPVPPGPAAGEAIAAPAEPPAAGEAIAARAAPPGEPPAAAAPAAGGPGAQGAGPAPLRPG